MSDVTIITNNHPRELSALWELPDDVRGEFDYVSEDDDAGPRFVKYKGEWYDTSDCDGLAANVGIAGWDLYASDSFFSGILFRWPIIGVDTYGNAEYDYDSVIVGRYYS